MYVKQDTETGVSMGL